jgi:hypothetical protein
MYDKQKFRELTKRIISAEKEGFWSDYTDFEKQEYLSKDWERFSRARGYSESEIEEFREFVNMIQEAKKIGINPYIDIHDLTTAGALVNIGKDKNNEILKTSHIFF